MKKLVNWLFGRKKPEPLKKVTIENVSVRASGPVTRFDYGRPYQPSAPTDHYGGSNLPIWTAVALSGSHTSSDSHSSSDCGSSSYDSGGSFDSGGSCSAD